MNRRVAPALKTIPCKRCGKLICTLSAPIHTSIETMYKYQGICGGCATEEEKQQLLHDSTEDIRNYVSGQQ